MPTLESLLTAALEKNQWVLAPETKSLLLRYLDLLQTWNRVFNLTTITDPQGMVYLHLMDSLLVSPYVQGQRCLDVGSGAGLPGLPLAIVNPQQQWVLLDKSSKKTRFLTQVVAELQLPNVEVCHARCEDFHPPLCFDSILSRAFGTISLFAQTTKHLLCPTGVLIAMKGKYPQTELAELTSSFSVSVQRVDIKGIDVERHIVLLTNQ